MRRKERTKFKIAFWIGSSFFTSSLGWLLTFIPKLSFGLVASYEAYMPFTLLFIGITLICLFKEYA